MKLHWNTWLATLSIACAGTESDTNVLDWVYYMCVCNGGRTNQVYLSAPVAALLFMHAYCISVSLYLYWHVFVYILMKYINDTNLLCLWSHVLTVVLCSGCIVLLFQGLTLYTVCAWSDCQPIIAAIWLCQTHCVPHLYSHKVILLFKVIFVVKECYCVVRTEDCGAVFCLFVL